MVIVRNHYDISTAVHLTRNTRDTTGTYNLCFSIQKKKLVLHNFLKPFMFNTYFFNMILYV